MATFSEKLGSLDTEIEIGKIALSIRDEPDEFLTRRQYVCTMFGYLAFLSLVITLFSITTVIISGGLPTNLGVSVQIGEWKFHLAHDLFRGIAIFAFGMIVAHLSVVTCHALYYLIDRLYAKKPELLPERGEQGAPPEN